TAPSRVGNERSLVAAAGARQRGRWHAAEAPMRVPASEVYRAFAELDRFSDDQCRQFVACAQRNRRWSRGAATLGAWLAAGTTWLVVGGLWLGVLSSAPVA